MAPAKSSSSSNRATSSRSQVPKPASDLRIPLRSKTLLIMEPSGITAFHQLECRASKLCDTVGAHENSSLNWTMMTTSQVPSCRFLKVCLAAAKNFVENKVESHRFMTQI